MCVARGLVIAVLGALLAAPAGASPFQVEWERTVHANTFRERQVTMRTSLAVAGGQLTGTLPGYRAGTWTLTSGPCWTGVGGVTHDEYACAFVSEEQTRRARCSRTRRVRHRVTVRRHGRRKRVWRHKLKTTHFSRDVKVTLQMELAGDDDDYSGEGEPRYLYPDEQWEYGNSPPGNPFPGLTPPVSPPAPKSEPVDPGYPQLGTHGIDCGLPDFVFWDDGTVVRS
jgi:hypothetical protein